MNKIIKLTMIIIIVLFLSLYFGKISTSIYENKNILTDDAIKRFEDDLNAGKKIVPSNYLPKEKNYSNKVSRLGRNASKVIENSFGRLLRYSLRYLEDIQNE